MASFNSAGYIRFKPAALSSGRIAKSFGAPQIRPAAIEEDAQCPYGAISATLAVSASAAHRLDLENLDRRFDASRQLKDTILNLKDRLARRVVMRAPLAVVDDSVELAYKAS